jgi:hypothetical protein
MSDDPNFEVLPGEEMRRRYGLYAQNAPIAEFDEAEVPEGLRSLIPLARRWGVGDDLIREDMLRKAERRELDELRAAVVAVEDELDAWLATPPSLGSPSDSAYIAFSNMRIAADSL